MSYYVYDESGEKYGPATLEELKQWASQNRINRDSVLEHDQNGWKGKASELPGLFPTDSGAVVADKLLQTGQQVFRPTGASAYGWDRIAAFGLWALAAINIFSGWKVIDAMGSVGVSLWGFYLFILFVVMSYSMAAKGCYEGKLYGFVLGAASLTLLSIVSAYLTLGGRMASGPADVAGAMNFGLLGITVSFTILFYCLLRLSGAVGGKPA